MGCRLHLVSRLEGERRLAEAACAGARRSAAAFAKKAEGMAAVETAAAAAADACAAQVARATAALEQQRAARSAAARAAADDLAAATAEAERAVAARDVAQADAAACVPCAAHFWVATSSDDPTPFGRCAGRRRLQPLLAPSLHPIPARQRCRRRRRMRLRRCGVGRRLWMATAFLLH